MKDVGQAPLPQNKSGTLFAVCTWKKNSGLEWQWLHARQEGYEEVDGEVELEEGETCIIETLLFLGGGKGLRLFANSNKQRSYIWSFEHVSRQE